MLAFQQGELFVCTAVKENWTLPLNLVYFEIPFRSVVSYTVSAVFILLEAAYEIVYVLTHRGKLVKENFV